MMTFAKHENRENLILETRETRKIFAKHGSNFASFVFRENPEKSFVKNPISGSILQKYIHVYRYMYNTVRMQILTEIVFLLHGQQSCLHWYP
jgi:hypothetical protein